MAKIKIAKLKELTGVGFGTSGIRDLNENLTNETVYIYTLAFLQHAKNLGNFNSNGLVAIAGDRRPSTERIMRVVAKAIGDAGCDYINCGLIPTPAVTLFGMQNNMPSIMVTGSHIPADRNGVKFSLVQGEILKADEAAINELEVEDAQAEEWEKLKDIDTRAKDLYLARYADFFGNLLTGKKVGLYGHSAVGRELTVELLERLGARVVKIEFSRDDEFVAVDTDSVDEKLAGKMRSWNKENDLDYIISTDGDGDRPLLTDEEGNLIRAEMIAVLAGKYLEVEAMACTLTASTAVDKSGFFRKIIKTKVGSPMVVSAMMELEKEGYKRVAGYELNGGFLLQTDLVKNDKKIARLPTRDALLPILSVIALAKEKQKTIRGLVLELPKRFTYSSSIKGIPTETSLRVLEKWEKYKKDIQQEFGGIKEVDLLDGLRLTFFNEDIVHFRPSKNSPEFRNYTESSSYEKAKILSEKAIELIIDWTRN